MANSIATLWTEKVFKFKLEDGTIFGFRYFKQDDFVNGAQHVVACKDLYESIGQAQQNFGKEFSKHIFDVLEICKQFNLHNRTKFTTLEDALRYVIDKNQAFRQAFITFGIQALVSREDDDLTALVATVCQCSINEAEHRIVEEARKKGTVRRNNLTNAIGAHGGYGWVYPSVTDKFYEATTGLDTKGLRKKFGMKKGTPRDKMTADELNAVSIIEMSAVVNLDASGAQGNQQILKVADYTADWFKQMCDEAKNLF